MSWGFAIPLPQFCLLTYLIELQILIFMAGELQIRLNRLIGLQILILNSVELQIALPFGQRPLVRQNGKNRPKMPLMPP